MELGRDLKRGIPLADRLKLFSDRLKKHAVELRSGPERDARLMRVRTSARQAVRSPFEMMSVHVNRRLKHPARVPSQASALDIQHTAQYTELEPDRFKDFWR